jgi:hypothetical protein
LKDYYAWFLILFVVVAACVVCYKSGYGEGYKLGSSMCPAIYPHDQNVQLPAQGGITPQGGK